MSDATTANADPNGSNENLVPDQIEDLKARAAKADEYWDRLLRISADFENFKKRAAREREETRKATTESVVSRLLGVVDNFDMAMAATNQPNTTVEILKAGVNMIHSQLRSTLSELGLEEINTAGQPFDPTLHEAVSQQDSTDVPEGHVLQQVRKGYRMRDRLLRPASVIVARKPTAQS